MSGDNAERIGLAGKIVVHVADRNGTVLAAVARDGVYEISDSGERRIWEGDARAAAIGPDGRFYVGTEPAMVFRSDDGGRTWRRSDKIDELPTREKWYFYPARRISRTYGPSTFSPNAEASVLVGVEVGGVVYSPDYGDSWSELKQRSLCRRSHSSPRPIGARTSDSRYRQGASTSVRTMATRGNR